MQFEFDPSKDLFYGLGNFRIVLPKRQTHCVREVCRTNMKNINALHRSNLFM